MTNVESTFSFKLLVGLTLLVLLVHLAVLRTPFRVPNVSQAESPRAFSTRSIALEPSRLTAPPSPLTTAATTPARRRPAVPQPTRQAGSQRSAAPADIVAAVEPALPVIEEEAVSTRAEDATTQDEAPSSADSVAQAPQPLREYAVLASADRLPASVQMKYQVEANKFPYSLSAEMLWQQDGSRYSARLAFNAFGQARVQTSRGQIGARGLEPIRFSDKYRSEVAAHFNREKGKVTFSANTPDVPLLAGAQDRLSILIQLAGMVASAPNRYPPATTISIQTIGPRDADTWLFTVGETETLSLPGGPQETLKLVRNPRQEFDQKVEIWLAPALDYLPARVRITEPNGDFIDQKWLSTEAVVEPLSLRFVPPRHSTLEIAHCAAKCTKETFKG